MRILLDTHVFLWYISANKRLPTGFRTVIENPANEVYLSSASIWEAVIKHRLGKLPLASPPEIYLPQKREAHRITALPIDEGAMAPLASLPSLHRDPFDRMLIAQAIQHGMRLATTDAEVLAYRVAALPTV